MSASFLLQYLLSSCVNAHRVGRIVQTPSIVYERQPTFLFMECESVRHATGGLTAKERESRILGLMIAHWGMKKP